MKTALLHICPFFVHLHAVGQPETDLRHTAMGPVAQKVKSTRRACSYRLSLFYRERRAAGRSARVFEDSRI
jgi:hypothetical protein